MQKSYDVVVIGSGFGGAVSALRLGEAGKSVLVLERGGNYGLNEFPRDHRRVDKLFWRYNYNPEHKGLFDLRLFKDLGVLCASGVGGGSLIYAGIMDKPDADVFSNDLWPDDIDSHSLNAYYTRVASELNLQVMPATISVPKRDLLHNTARIVQQPSFDLPLAVEWETCKLCGECEIGCNHGAKNSLDRTYLKKAQALGVRVRPHSMVMFIEPAFGGYVVHFVDLVQGAIRKQVKAKSVVLSAGALGSVELLLKSCHRYETLPRLSELLGQRFSANGDFIGTLQNTREVIHPWCGPDVTSIIQFRDGQTRFNLVAPSYNERITRIQASMGQPQGALLRLIGPVVWKHLPQMLPWLFSSGILQRPRAKANANDALRYTNFFAIGRDNGNGVIRLCKHEIDIRWNYAYENQHLIKSIVAGMEQTAQAYGGKFSPAVFWNMAKKIITVHPLGGCVMHQDRSRGVVTSFGEVHGYPGLFVADGSIIPTALGCHPAMTIAALAERNVSAVIDYL